MQAAPSTSTSDRFIASVLAGTMVWVAMVPPALAQTASSGDKPAAVPTQAAPTATAAPSEESREAARQAFGEGQAAFQAGDYPTAEQHFSKANQAVPSAHSLYWVAMSIDMQGKTPEAVAALEAFLADPGAAAVGEDKVAAARARLDALQKIPATLALTVTPPNAVVTVDGAAQPGASPFGLKLPVGAHKISVTAEGHKASELEVTVRPGESAERTVQLEELPKPAAPPPTEQAAPAAPPPEPPSKVPAYITLGIAGASAVVGTIFGVLALSAKSDYDQNPTVDKADEVERNALIADMAWGVTLTLGITGFVLLTNDEVEQVAHRPPPRRAQARVNVAPFFSPTSGGAAAHVTF